MTQSDWKNRVRGNPTLTRRRFLAGASAAGAWLTTASGCRTEVEPVPPARLAHPPLALQLYSLREAAAQDFPAVLSAVAQMGYQGVEFAGYHGHSAERLRGFLDDLGLRSAGCHLRLNALQGEEFERNVEFSHTLGSPFLIVPFHAEQPRASRVEWIELAEIFNQIGERLEPHGMRVGFHNYDTEFRPIEDELPWHIFARHTRPEVVLQLDTAAATRGGGEVVSLLEPHPGRFASVHLEDHSPDGAVVLPGDGIVPFEEILGWLLRSGGTEWLIVEQEQHPESYSPLESVEECLRRLQSFLNRAPF